ncbi:ATP-binding protein [Dactylosporangium sp. CA-092794]|uniref:ATP-binding protein n=1 Tax=Dactylosporangium sp. CA-092794 TaxID=3239929 RepID=UPI003D8D6797
MATSDRRLLDRHEERGAIDRVLAGARAGAGGVLVLRGELGIGRTALLEHAVGRAAGMHVVRLAGIESETELDFAALHRLLTPFAAELDRLPADRHDALRAAFGLIAAPSPDRCVVGLAVRAALTDAAADRPLLVVVDDAHWLDRATTESLAFLVRRLTTEPIAFLIAVREPAMRGRPLDGLPDIRLRGLPERDAHRLLASVAGGPPHQRVARRIVAEAGGNPLALVEFGRRLVGDRPAPARGPLPISGRLQRQFLRRMGALPPDTRTLLLLAAAEPEGGPALLPGAAARLGLGPGAAGPAEAAGLLAGGETVAFRHPLARSAIYHGASPHDRRRVHAALAAVVDPWQDPDRYAWHLAAATAGPDERVAAELARSAAQARGRGDHPAEAALLTRAAELTPDETRRAGRLLDGAVAELSAGAPVRAEALLDRADPAVAGPPGRVRIVELRAAVSLARGRFDEAPAALLRAARQIGAADPARARRTLLDAMYAGIVAGTGALPDIAAAARSRPVAAPSPPTVEDLLLCGFATRLTVGYRAAVADLREAVARLTTGPGMGSDIGSGMGSGIGSGAGGPAPRLLAMGGWAAGELMDDEAQRALAIRRLAAGWDEPPGAAAAGLGGGSGRDLLVLAWHGREAETRAAAAEPVTGLGGTVARCALTILELGLGRYQAALTAALEVYRDDAVCFGTLVLPDLVEAAARAGDRAAAGSALERFAGRAHAAGTPLAAGLLARSRALLAGAADAEGLYREAIEHLGDGAAQLARAHLLYGEWLRRRRRRRDAREQLRTARDMFGALWFEAFERRAHSELLATGEQVSKRTGAATERLTPQEAQVARLVVDGFANRQIAAQLFISLNTVEYHLQKVYRKVGVTSRTQLVHAVLDEPAAAPSWGVR